MIYLLLALILAILGAVVYLSILPANFEVRRALLMNVDRQRVFDRVRDLAGWGQWSPWLMHEPGARIAYRGQTDRPGGAYSWDGKHIGAGTLTHVRLEAPSRIEQRIVFVRPFKSESQVWWEFADRDGQTEVTWGMRGRMPFFLRFLTGLTASMVEKDYALGLAMLRGTLDPQAERPQIRFLGETDTATRSALVIPFSGSMDAMVKAMQQGFPRLIAHIRDQGKEPAGPPFTAYSKVSARAKHFECDMAVPATEDTMPGAFERKRLGGGRCYVVELHGSYDFLELAWYSAMAHLRMYRIPYDRRRPFIETYENDPATLEHSNALRTRLEVPIR